MSFPYRRIILLTGHDNGTVRQKMADALRCLTRDVEVHWRKVRGQLDDPDTLVVVDTRFIQHKMSDVVKDRCRSRYIEVCAGAGGIAEQVRARLHLPP